MPSPNVFTKLKCTSSEMLSMHIPVMQEFATETNELYWEQCKTSLCSKQINMEISTLRQWRISFQKSPSIESRIPRFRLEYFVQTELSTNY